MTIRTYGHCVTGASSGSERRTADRHTEFAPPYRLITSFPIAPMMSIRYVSGQVDVHELAGRRKHPAVSGVIATGFRLAITPRSLPQTEPSQSSVTFSQPFAGLSNRNVSHQQRSRRSTAAAVEPHRRRRKINGSDLYPAADNGPVAGSSPAGPINEINNYADTLRTTRFRILLNRMRLRSGATEAPTIQHINSRTGL